MNDDMQQPTPLNINQQPDLEPQAPPPQPGQQFKPDTPLNKPKKSKKKIVLIILLLLVLTGGAAAAYFLFYKKDVAAPAPQPQSQQTQDKMVTSGPVALSYITRASSEKPDTINSLVLSDNSTGKPFELAGYQAAMDSDIVGNSIAILATPKQGNSQSAIFYSNNNGETYTKIFETEASSESASLGDQITSLSLSSDGSSVAIGLLPNETGKNVATEIDPKTKTTKTLFTSDQAGVFIHGYNKDKQIVYTKGCYNCGGELQKTIYSYDINNKKESVLTTTKDAFDKNSIIANKDFSSIAYIETGLSVEEIGDPFPMAPYNIKQINLDDGKVKTLKTIGKTGERLVTLSLGFMADGKTPYYVAEKTITALNNTRETVLFESTKDYIYAAYYASNDMLYFSLGSDNPTLIYSYKNSDKKLTQLLKDTRVLRIIGINSDQQ